MADIVFLTLDGGGNVPPALAIAAELASRGHRIRFLGHANQEPAIIGAGFRFRPYRIARPWTPAEKLPAVAEARAILTLIGDRGYAKDLADELKREAADAVVIDSLIPGSIRAAIPLGVPVVVLMHTFAEFFLTNPMSTIASGLHGFSAKKAWASAAATIVTSDPALDPASRTKAPANFVWTGVAEVAPTVPAQPADPPRVLVSLSSVGAPGQERVMQAILDAIAPMPITAVVTTGPTMDPAALRAGGNTEVHRQLPHAELLPTCSAVVGHGGHSTAMRALMHGLPLVILPCDTRIDQPMVGRAVAEAGAGITISKKSSPERIREALGAVLQEPSYREAAATVGKRLRESNGVATAADRILLAAAQAPAASRVAKRTAAR